MIAPLDEQLAGVAVLRDPTRRALFSLVSNSVEPVSRERASAELGVTRSLAGFHLDKLVDGGFLDFEFRRLTGRTGPGAGRPAKLYRRSERQIELSLPHRDYGLAGILLADAIEAAETSGRAVSDELERSSYDFGGRSGERAKERARARGSTCNDKATLLNMLREHGFEPRDVGSEVVLLNCPFHALARDHADLVCGMNLHLLRGIRSAVEAAEDELQPRLDPQPGHCCVRFRIRDEAR